MRQPLLVLTLILAFALPASGDTHTPFPAGTRVSVTTSAGTVTGELQDTTSPDWIGVIEPGQQHTTFVRGRDLIVRRAGIAEVAEAPARSAQPSAPAADASDSEPAEALEGHYIYGRPRIGIDHFSFKPSSQSPVVDGISYHVREAFTLGHFHRMRTPAWVAMRWTSADLTQSNLVSYPRPPFARDLELPLYAQTGKDFDFSPQNPLEKGHMARDADLEAWGEDAVAEGVLMSNICPQLKGRNHAVWGKLEDQHRLIVENPQQSGIGTVWIYSGPVYFDDDGDGEIEESETVRVGDDKVAVPDATYKVIAWHGPTGLNVRAYVIEQNDTDTNLANYLVPVDELEELTGLDFFWQLDDEEEDLLEAQTHDSLWN